LARAYTNRDKVLCCGYHGWHDWYVAVTARRDGVPQAVQELTHTFSYNDLQSVLDAIDQDTACVILEPVVFEPPKDNFLARLKTICEDNGVLLIFDEMWTGFRLALGGAQEYFGVTADLACYSKAIANGMPLSVLAGRRDVMELCDTDVFFFTTFGGEALSLAAAKATINELRDKQVPAYLAEQGRKLKDGYNSIAAASVQRCHTASALPPFATRTSCSVNCRCATAHKRIICCPARSTCLRLAGSPLRHFCSMGEQSGSATPTCIRTAHASAHARLQASRAKSET